MVESRWGFEPVSYQPSGWALRDAVAWPGADGYRTLVPIVENPRESGAGDN